MKEIKNVLICGIGAIGSIYADKIHNYKNAKLKILADKDRLKKYLKYPKVFNGKTLNLECVLPEDNGYKADLIIISTKFDGLEFAINGIKNFLKSDTVILSLLNGVNSEELIAQKYGWEHVLISYFIGHSAMREGNKINFDGVGKIIFGSDRGNYSDIERVKSFFDMVGIDYEIAQDILRAYWLKYMLNVSGNQVSAILGYTFGQMQSNPNCMKLIKNIMNEVLMIAKIKGIKNTDTMVEEALLSFNKMIPEGKTSMLQDIEAGRATEIGIFADAMIEFGKQYNIPVPYNKVLKELIEVKDLNQNNLNIA